VDANTTNLKGSKSGKKSYDSNREFKKTKKNIMPELAEQLFKRPRGESPTKQALSFNEKRSWGRRSKTAGVGSQKKSQGTGCVSATYLPHPRTVRKNPKPTTTCKHRVGIIEGRSGPTLPNHAGKKKKGTAQAQVKGDAKRGGGSQKGVPPPGGSKY